MWTETLSLTGLSESDEGTYMCQIYRYPLQYSAKELVNILVKVPKPTISLGRIHFYEEDKIINCTLRKNGVNPQQVNFTWYSCGFSKCDKSNLITISNSYSLRLESQLSNRMNFRCEATNAAGSAHQDIVVVIVPNAAWKDRTYFRQLRIQGEWIKINCAIRTSENVTLWFGKTKGKITKKLEVDNKKIRLVSKNVFNITDLTTKDRGWYTCQVCGGKHAKFLEVLGQGKAYAKPIVEKKPNKAFYFIEDSVKLTCRAEGITVAVYDIIWYKLSCDGKFKKVRTGGNYVNGMWTETLSLTELSESDEGTYMCQIYRYPLQYSAKELVNIRVKADDPSNSSD